MKNEQNKQSRQLASIAIVGFAILALLTVAIVFTGCVAKHPKCAAYDKVEHDPMFKTNLERSLYK